MEFFKKYELLECENKIFSSTFSGFKLEWRERDCETLLRRKVELGDVSKDSPETCFLRDAGDKDPPTRDKKSTRGKGLPAISPQHFLQPTPVIFFNTKNIPIEEAFVKEKLFNLSEKWNSSTLSLSLLTSLSSLTVPLLHSPTINRPFTVPNTCTQRGHPSVVACIYRHSIFDHFFHIQN